MDLSTLPTAGELMPLSHACAPRWQPGLACALYGEVFACGSEASGAALALALALDGLGQDAFEQHHVLWVQDKAALRLTGRPYRPGLPSMLRDRVIHVAAATPEDALFAIEEGVRCCELACVIGEIAGNPRALDFTASRRLTLAAERHGVALVLVRLDAMRDLSSARMRWQVAAAPSLPPHWNAAAPGASAWRAELFRARTHPPGEWILHDEKTGLRARPSTSSERAGESANPQNIRSA